MRTQNVSIVLENLEEFRPTSEISSTRIWWRFDGVAFPDPWWFDNPGVILGWWGAQIRNLLLGAKTVKLYFMEGPYSLTLRSDGGDEVEVSTPEWEEPQLVPLNELVEAVQEALRRVAPTFETVPELRPHARILWETVEVLDRHLHNRERTQH